MPCAFERADGVPCVDERYQVHQLRPTIEADTHSVNGDATTRGHSLVCPASVSSRLSAASTLITSSTPSSTSNISTIQPRRHSHRRSSASAPSIHLSAPGFSGHPPLRMSSEGKPSSCGSHSVLLPLSETPVRGGDRMPPAATGESDTDILAEIFSEYDIKHPISG